MNPFDLFKPYSPETRGDLEAYLRKYDGSQADNLFQGSTYFFVMIENRWVIPRVTTIRVNQSPIPDVSYWINEQGLLESNGPDHANMSCMGAPRGVYDPIKALEGKVWSVHGLDIDGLAREVMSSQANPSKPRRHR